MGELVWDYRSHRALWCRL